MKKSLVDGNLNLVSSVKKPKSVKPTGCLILVEMLTKQELLGTVFTVLETASDIESLKMSPQAWVRAAGPGFKPENHGFQVGDRVVCMPGSVPCPVPKPEGSDREWLVIDPSAVKGVIQE